jgi:dTDP-4-amino-4,6-dideoxygalactose transaminase
MPTGTLTAIPFAAPALGTAEIDEVVATLQSGWLATGPRVSAFERAFAEYVGAPHAVALNSGTAALHLAVLAAGVVPGDEVITTPLTFCATANVIVHAGATPRFADVDPTTWNLVPAAAASEVSSRTRALIPVHYAGRAVDMAGFRAVGARHGLAVIEDAAHAIESAAGGLKVGASADFTCFSFYATKNLTTGEGGMLTTAAASAAAFVRVASLHGLSRDAWKRYGSGSSPHYDVLMPGYKYNMMDLQAAIGLHQLAGIADRLRRREAIWRLYDEGLADLPLTRPAPAPAGDVHARHLYTILVESASGWSRDGLIAALAAEGISTGVHFRALHLHPYYAERFNLTRGMFPVAERISDRVISLPLSAAMSTDDAARVVSTIRALMARRGSGRA